MADKLARLDSLLCEVKELQIRDGLHVFGRAPEGEPRTDLLVALARAPRGRGEAGDASLLRALAADLRLDWDPLAASSAKPGPARGLPSSRGSRPLAHPGDTVERLELLAAAWSPAKPLPDPGWAATRAVLDTVERRLAPAIDVSGRREIAALLAGLDGRRVPPGPSGAPTRGRPEVLPTGRNFYSVDCRAVPTPAAWPLGWRSAELVVEQYLQRHGTWPRQVALSAWGTANMRTGGDDIAQALALLGCRPVWDPDSRRVTGVEVLPLAVLGRPAGRRHLAGLRLLPRRLPGPDRAARRCRAGGGAPRRAGGRQPASRRRPRRDRERWSPPACRKRPPGGDRSRGSLAASPVRMAPACRR